MMGEVPVEASPAMSTVVGLVIGTVPEYVDVVGSVVGLPIPEVESHRCLHISRRSRNAFSQSHHILIGEN